MTRTTAKSMDGETLTAHHSFLSDVTASRLSETAAYVAEQLCIGFRAHDNGCRQEAIDAFFEVDRRQFAHLDDATTLEGATAYVDALWEKDAVEADYANPDGTLQREALDTADWGRVEESFGRRAEVLGIDERYATESAEAWRQHKVGGDYWTPMMAAQMYEIRAATQDPSYPEKPSDGLSGFGPEATRYALGVELHDMHTRTHWEEAARIMKPYFEYIFSAHRDQTRLATVTISQ